MALMLTLTAWSQTRKVSGIVKDQAGDPVPFVTVTVKGTKVSVAGTAAGGFTIPAKSGDVLVFSAVGFKSLEAPVGSDDLMGPVMERVAGNTNVDVVVTTTFGVQRQAKSLGYATTKVSSKELIQAKPVNVQNGLTGKVAGLQVNTVNNSVTSPTRIVLRGNRSLTGNNQALIVVDGAIFYNDLSTLNPEDIADINTLKGASAATLYGSDASNGVLVITTKKGSKNATNINVTSTTQFETISYMPAFQNRFGSGSADYVNGEFIRFNDYSAYTPFENQSYGPEYNSNLYLPLGRPQEDSAYQVVRYAALPNEKRNFFDVGITTQNQFSISNGDNNGSILLSYQNVSTKGTMPNDELKRNAVRISGRRSFNKFSTDFSVSYTNQNTNTVALSRTGSVFSNLYQTPMHVPITQYSDLSQKYSDPSSYFNDYAENPYWDIANNRNISKNNSLQGSVGLSFMATDWLSFNYRAGATYSGNDFQNNVAGVTYTTFAKTSPLAVFATPDGSSAEISEFGPKFLAGPQAGDFLAGYANSKTNNFLWTSDFTINFDRDIVNKLNLKALVGTSYMDNIRTNSVVGAPALIFEVYNVDSRLGNPTAEQSFAQARRLGILGDLTLGYDNKMFLHGAYRYDIDSRLPEENRGFSYYGVDASFILTDIVPTIKSEKLLSYAKLRAAYSITGNASPLGFGSQFIASGAYQTTQIYEPATGFPFGSTAGFTPSTVFPSKDIKPETIREIEVGFDFRFLNDRINFNGAVYETETSDGIVFASVSPGTGGSRYLTNAANTRNKGLELTLSYVLINNKNVNWMVSANWSHIQTKVISINADATELQIGGSNGNAFAVVGQPFPIIKTSDWLRDSVSGKIIVDPVTGLPSADPTFRNFGTTNPTDNIGINTTFRWKAFTISAVADYRGGHEIFNSQGSLVDFGGISTTSASTGRQPFVMPNSVVLQDGKYVDNTNITTNTGNYNFWSQLYNAVGYNYIISAAVWKLREVAITYQLPSAWLLSTKFIKSASFTLSGRNLLMIRPKTNIWTDPEFSDGTDNSVGRASLAQAPPTRIYGATLSVNF